MHCSHRDVQCSEPRGLLEVTGVLVITPECQEGVGLLGRAGQAASQGQGLGMTWASVSVPGDSMVQLQQRERRGEERRGGERAGL